MQDHQAETDASGYYTGRKLFLLQRNLLPRIPDRSKYRNSNRIPDDQQAGGNRSDQPQEHV